MYKLLIDGKLATPNDPWVTHCGFCGRPETVCNADDHGCGSTPAEDAEPPPSGWRDRDKLT